MNWRVILLPPLLFLIGCAVARPPVPVGVIPEPQPLTVEDEQYGHDVLNQLSQQFQLDYNNPQMSRIQDVVDKLTAAANASKDPWHVYVFKDDSFKNAAATRGNHIFIWTGMLNEVQSDAELAVILAHEIGHVLARHTEPDPNEEFKRIMIQVGALAAGIAVAAATNNPNISTDLGQLTQVLTQEVGEGLLMNPFSREQELEADRIGLILLAQAGYDPRDALNFWRRAENNPDFSSSVPFFSTHPPADERLNKLEEILPLAESRFKKETDPTLTTPMTAQAADEPSNLRPETPQIPPPIPSQSWQVREKVVSIYARPSSGARKVGELTAGTVLELRDDDGDWVEIGGVYSGWVAKEGLTPPGKVESAEKAPVGENPVVPTLPNVGK